MTFTFRRRSRAAAWFSAVALVALVPGAAGAQATQPQLLSHAAPYGSRVEVTTPAHADAVRAGRQMIADYMARRGVPGASVAMSIDGRLVWSEGFGLADVEQGVPVTPSTRFRSGSTAKPMSMAAAAILHDRGQLDFDAVVQDLVPDFPVQSRPITFRMLAGMLGGLRHYRLGTDDFFNPRSYDNVLDYVETFKNDPLIAEPGTKYSYSSPGTNLQGAMTQAAGGKPFPILMQELVFGPLGMVSTTPDWNDSIIPNRTRYYERTGGRRTYRIRESSWGDGERGVLLNAPYTDNSNKFPSGGYLTTPEDLVTFGATMLAPGFYSAETLAELVTVQRTSDGTPTGYGMNWSVEDKDGELTYSHGGSSVGGNSILIVFPRHKAVFAMQTNLTDSDLGELPEQLAGLFLR